MKKDPIVAEIHKIRENIYNEHRKDISGYFNKLKKKEKAHTSRLINQKFKHQEKV
jgi:hypothetical protein